MVDVFISYSRINQAHVARLADAVRAEGYSVWWDAELPPHRSYSDVITETIAGAKAAIVVWSEAASGSEWVRAEADLARNAKKLIQASLDGEMPPMPFNQIQYAFIGDWQGESDHMGWRKIKASLADLCGAPQAESPPGLHPATQRQPAAASPPVACKPDAPPQGAAWASPAAVASPRRAAPSWVVPVLVLGLLAAGGAITWLLLKDRDGQANARPNQSQNETAGAISGSAPATNQASAPQRAPVATVDTQSSARTQDTALRASYPYSQIAWISDPRPGLTNVRAGPTINDAIIAKVDRDEPFLSFEQDGDWWQVKTRDGSVGWMSRKMIRLTGPAPGAEE